MRVVVVPRSGPWPARRATTGGEQTAVAAYPCRGFSRRVATGRLATLEEFNDEGVASAGGGIAMSSAGIRDRVSVPGGLVGPKHYGSVKPDDARSRDKKHRVEKLDRSPFDRDPC
jgi:hypothetical protein